LPVEFLTPSHRAYYGRYAEEPTSAQLARYFHLDDTDRVNISKRRSNHNRLGLALQLCTVRFLGTFLSDPTDVPLVAINYVASQLSIYNTQILERYRISQSRWDHTAEIRDVYGYKDFHAQPEHWRLVRWLYSRSWLSVEPPSLVFDLATAWLVERKILLPGVTVLERLIASVRERTAKRLWRILLKLPTPDQQKRLEDLLLPTSDNRLTYLEQLRRPPTRLSAKAMVAALNRLLDVRSFDINKLDLSRIPPNRLLALARYANTAWAQTLVRMPLTRRIATLLAFIYILEFTATDDVIDLLDLLIEDLLNRASRQGEKERLRTLKDLDTAALQLCEACSVLLDPTTSDESVRQAVFARIPQYKLTLAVNRVKALARPPDDNYYELMRSRWRHVRLFLPKLLRVIEFGGTEAGSDLLEALNFLKAIEGMRKPNLSAAPLAIVSQSWAKWVIHEDGTVDQKAYTFCGLENLRVALRRRDIFVEKSFRWRDPRIKLLQGAAWESTRSNVCRTLSLHSQPEVELEALARLLDEAYRRTVNSFPTNAAVRIEIERGRPTLVVSGLDKLEDPLSLIVLKEQVSELLLLDRLARHRVNLNLIARNWDDLLRVAGSLKLGMVSASELMRTLLGGKNPTTLSRALAELGKIVKTLYLLTYIDDENYRRRILTQLNRGEGPLRDPNDPNELV
jgi:hypothetical protein